MISNNIFKDACTLNSLLLLLTAMENLKNVDGLMMKKM